MWTDQHSDRLDRIEQMMHSIKRHMETNEMARKETDAAIIAEVHRSSEVVKAAIAEWAKELADLTAKLADAVASSDAADDQAVQDAIVELRVANDALVAKVSPPVQQA